jgi:hypothetical protein
MLDDERSAEPDEVRKALALIDDKPVGDAE